LGTRPLVGACGAADPVIPLAKAQRREASAPAARFLGYFSRKGAKDAKDTKGREEEGKKKSFVSDRSV